MFCFTEQRSVVRSLLKSHISLPMKSMVSRAFWSLYCESLEKSKILYCYGSKWPLKTRVNESVLMGCEWKTQSLFFGCPAFFLLITVQRSGCSQYVLEKRFCCDDCILRIAFWLPLSCYLLTSESWLVLLCVYATYCRSPVVCWIWIPPLKGRSCHFIPLQPSVNLMSSVLHLKVHQMPWRQTPQHSTDCAVSALLKTISDFT